MLKSAFFIFFIIAFLKFHIRLLYAGMYALKTLCMTVVGQWYRTGSGIKESAMPLHRTFVLLRTRIMSIIDDDVSV